MQTQNTQIHIRLWHRDFWLMVVANMLLSASAYMQLPVLPQWLATVGGLTWAEIGVTMGAFGVGLYCLGAFCSYLVQRFRRNVVCMMSVLCTACCSASLYYADTMGVAIGSMGAMVALRIGFGAFFGLAQMVLSSTLIIDTSESFQRTEANHISAWFYRFGILLGPMAGLMVSQLWGYGGVAFCSVGCALVAVVLIRMVKFPFRTPEDGVQLVSLDRFFLPQGLPLFVNLAAVTVVVGLLFSLNLSYVFFGMMMVGFLLALLAQRFVFQNAELKSEVVVGLILIGASLLMLLTRQADTVAHASPVLFGCGMGIIGSRFLLFFVKLSRHCQRGTSQSTFILAWETGLAIGICIGHALLHDMQDTTLTVALCIAVVALLLYVLFTHKWYMTNKNR